MQSNGLAAAAQLRKLLAEPDMVVAPGAYDGVGARTIEQAGFAAVYMTGGGTSVARGFPDYGLLGMTEMADNAGTLARSVTVPVIADADTGYGNELNVTRMIREYEGRGVAAIHLEDQVSPKRCGHLEGKELVPIDEFVVKIRAAVAARRSPDFVIIARTDARAVTGLTDAVRRANAALDAGADLAFIEATPSLEELAAIPSMVKGPMMLNLIAGGKTPLVSLEDAQAMGYRISILPGMLLMVAIHAFDTALAELKQSGRAPEAPAGATLATTFGRFGAAEWDGLRTAFLDVPS